MSQAPELDRRILNDLFRFNASLGVRRAVKGIDYVRTMELPVLAAELLRHGSDDLAYLDIGSGESILPTFITARTSFRVTALDKFQWLRAQTAYLRRLGMTDAAASGRFRVVEEDFLATAALAPESFDVISAVSVFEHIDGDGDSQAVQRAFELLKPGGRLLLTCPFNCDRAADYHVGRPVYGAPPGAQGAFFQRHYSSSTFQARLLDAAPFEVSRVFYASHYGGPNLFKHLCVLPTALKPLKVLYAWATPLYVPRLMRLGDEPPTDELPRMVTADTAFAFLTKPGG